MVSYNGICRSLLPGSHEEIANTEKPTGDLRVVKDFLPPPPDQLVLREENVKVTISLKKSSITFFKEQAKKQKTQPGSSGTSATKD
jgi:hypothetical protein